MTAGTIFLMWLGEQIDEYGIGNGISLLIMAGILARMPVAMKGLWENSTSKLTPEPGKYGIITILLLIGLFIAVVVGVIAITESQRRIPTQSAKHVRGRRVFGGTRQYLPLKVNQAGVMPIIFASSLLIFPSFVFNSLARATAEPAVRHLDARLVLRRALPGAGRRLPAAELHLHRLLHHPDLLLLLLLDGDHVQPEGHGREPQGLRQLHPGLPAGRRTADYLEKVMLRITYVGAAFLALVAVIPSLVQTALNVDFTVASFLGGTGLLIVISVCLDLVQKIDSHLVMRNYSRPGEPEVTDERNAASRRRLGDGTASAITEVRLDVTAYEEFERRVFPSRHGPRPSFPSFLAGMGRQAAARPAAAPARDQAQEPARDRADARGRAGRRQGARPRSARWPCRA